MKTLKDKEDFEYFEDVNKTEGYVRSKYLKQAIKDLKEEMWNDGDFSFGSAICAIDKIFGAWEEC